jgi:hypothetical protein
MASQKLLQKTDVAERKQQQGTMGYVSSSGIDAGPQGKF